MKQIGFWILLVIILFATCPNEQEMVDGLFSAMRKDNVCSLASNSVLVPRVGGIVENVLLRNMDYVDLFLVSIIEVEQTDVEVAIGFLGHVFFTYSGRADLCKILVF